MVWNPGDNESIAQFGYAAPGTIDSNSSETDVDRSAFYYPATDSLYLPLDPETFETVYDKDGLQLDAINNSHVYNPLVSHEYGHIRLSKSTELWDRFFVMSSAAAIRFIHSIDVPDAQSTEEYVEILRDCLKYTAGINVFLDSWRPVQEAYAEIHAAYAAYGSKFDTTTYLMNYHCYLDSELEKLGDISVDLANPPTVPLVSNLNERKAFRIKYQQVAIKSAIDLFGDHPIDAEADVMKFINYIATFASRDSPLKESYRVITPKQYIESMIMASRCSDLLPFGNYNRYSDPKNIAEHITQSLGYPLPEESQQTREEYIHELLIDRMDGVLPDNVDDGQIEEIEHLWAVFTERPDPYQVILHNKETGDLVNIYRNSRPKIQYITEAASIMRELLKSCIFHGSNILTGETMFDILDENQAGKLFHTEDGFDLYMKTKSVYEQLKEDNKTQNVYEWHNESVNEHFAFRD